MSDDLSIPSPTYRIPRHHQGMDPATRRLALIAGGLGGVLLAVVGGWTLIGHRNAAVPVVQADSRPIRVKPDNPGGMQVAGADADILSGGTEMKDGKLAPAPEAPAPQALTAPPAPPPVVAAPVPAPAPGGGRASEAGRSQAGAAPLRSGRRQRRQWRAGPTHRGSVRGRRQVRMAASVQAPARPAGSAQAGVQQDRARRQGIVAGADRRFRRHPPGHRVLRQGARQGRRLLGGRLLKAAIVGIAGPALSADETALLRAEPPCGVILFARNIQTRRSWRR